MYDILAILIPFFLAICIVTIIRIVTDHRLRRHLAESETDLKVVEALLQSDQKNRHDGALRWGTLSLTLGIGMVLIHLFALSAEDALAYGILFISTGLGLIITRLFNR